VIGECDFGDLKSQRHKAASPLPDAAIFPRGSFLRAIELLSGTILPPSRIAHATRKAFMVSRLSLIWWGLKMRTALAVIALATACLLAAGCFAQSTSHFQSVGGEYGQNLISSFKAQNPQTDEESSKSGSLWNWGSAPKGSMIVGGELIVDPTYILRNLTRTSNWLGDTYVDPYSSNPAYTYTDSSTGEPVYAYTDPNTGQPYYTYKDPNTGKQVYVYVDPITGQPTHATLTPIASTNAVAGGVSLPPIFR